MTRKELLKLKSEKEGLREKLQATYHQVCGQIMLLDDLLSKLPNEEPSQQNEPNNL